MNTASVPALRCPGPHSGWEEVRAAFVREGAVVVHARVGALLPGGRASGAGGGPARPGRARDRSAASRLLLRSVAGALLLAPPEEVEVARAPGGRPYLRGVDGLDVSIGHTGDLLAVGVSRLGRIGVDVERAERRMTALGTERHACTPYELQALRSVPEEGRDRELVRLWTLKEAYSKATGQGLRLRFTEFGFDGGPPGSPVRMLLPDGTPAEVPGWTFHSVRVGVHVLGVALHCPRGPALTA
ncbi:4'-phosphopantetheinyl transferase family protein [Streptomyces sp. Da 82-17]|uniref:4'-phosphopantetheinyl transferase family protein n=1 Tax=Streptomyces sp. Da 82-17 TaxID=3377116 RepID=UPI0038D382CD